MSGGGRLDNQFDLTMAGGTASPGIGFVLFGETITYWTQGGPGVAASSEAITAVRSATPDVVERDSDEKTKWTISATDVADPSAHDYLFDDAGQRWDIVRITPEEGGVFILTCIHAQDQ